MKSKNFNSVQFPSFPNQSPAGDGDVPPADNVEAIKAKNAELLKEKKKIAEDYRKTQQELAELKAKQQEFEDAQALKAGEHLKLYETEKEKAKRLELELAERDKKHKELLDGIKFSRRANALKSSIGQLDPKFGILLEPFFDKIECDDDGNALESSIQKLTKDFQSQYGELIGKNTDPTFPKTKPNGSGGGDGKSGFFEGPITQKNLKEKRALMAEAAEQIRKDQQQRRK